MKTTILLRTSALSLAMVFLSSCTGLSGDIRKVFAPNVSENPYRGATPPSHTPRSTSAQGVSEWAPTTRQAASPAVPTQQARAQVAVTPPPAKIDLSKPPVPTPAKPAVKPVMKPQEKLPPPPRAVPPSTVTQAQAPEVEVPVPQGEIYRVVVVPQKPTHVYHPLNSAKIIRITDKNGKRYPSGTVMRVPNESIRFYVP